MPLQRHLSITWKDDKCSGIVSKLCPISIHCPVWRLRLHANTFGCQGRCLIMCDESPDHHPSGKPFRSSFDAKELSGPNVTAHRFLTILTGAVKRGPVWEVVAGEGLGSLPGSSPPYTVSSGSFSSAGLAATATARTAVTKRRILLSEGILSDFEIWIFGSAKECICSYELTKRWNFNESRDVLAKMFSVCMEDCQLCENVRQRKNKSLRKPGDLRDFSMAAPRPIRPEGDEAQDTDSKPSNSKTGIKWSPRTWIWRTSQFFCRHDSPGNENHRSSARKYSRL